MDPASDLQFADTLNTVFPPSRPTTIELGRPVKKAVENGGRVDSPLEINITRVVETQSEKERMVEDLPV